MKWQSNAKRNQPVEEGTIFTNKNSPLQLHRIHGCSGWYLSCPNLNISDKSLGTDDFDDAVKKAKIVVERRMREIAVYFYCFLKDDTENEIVRY